CLQGKEFPLTF
nr:immunoglobulin light chain junction region [Macaca mulatta]